MCCNDTIIYKDTKLQPSRLPPLLPLLQVNRIKIPAEI